MTFFQINFNSIYVCTQRKYKISLLLNPHFSSVFLHNTPCCYYILDKVHVRLAFISSLDSPQSLRVSINAHMSRHSFVVVSDCNNNGMGCKSNDFQLLMVRSTIFYNTMDRTSFLFKDSFFQP